MKQTEKKSRRYLSKLIIVFFIVLIASLYYKGCVHRPPYDAVKIAASETVLWKAYYKGEKKKLVWELVNLHRTQFGMTLLEALKVSKELGEAAYIFSQVKSDYEEATLPYLRKAYSSIREYRNENFDVEAVSRAELSWWIARRTPGKNSPEQVGAEIANLYALLYGETNPDIQRAGYLRARAACLRDQQESNPDWREIERLLRESYKALVKGVKQ
ncbi:hypothetical protein JW926_03455 [Candidatus Sumerlaeota bacterium]|nr:hypothetical protein [Candidatus Sumerlaeota bacterium]